MKKIKKWFRGFCEITSEHWIITALLTTGSSFWLSLLLTYFGDSWKLVFTDGNDRTLSIRGKILVVLVFIILCISTLVKRYKELHNEEKNKLTVLESGYNLFDRVLTTVGEICNHKYSTQIKTIEEIKANKIEPPIIYSKPCDQLEDINSKMSNCIAYALSDKGRKFSSNDLYVSIAYNFPLEDKETWKWSDNSDEKGLSIKELLKDGSTFSYLLKNSNKQHSSEFYNSKQDAFEKHRYIPDEYDKYDSKKELKGSIACFKLNLKKADTTYVTAIISLSSYERQFVDVSPFEKESEKLQEINTVRKNIENVIVAELSERIKIELCNYYLQFLRQKWEKGQSSK